MTTLTADQPRRERARHVAFSVWAVALSALVGLTFVGVTALTVGLWLAGQNTATNPVLDLGFFALGGILVTTGLVAQIRLPERRMAGVRQAVVGLSCLALAGLIGDRIEPLVGGLIFLAATGVLAALHPARRALLAVGSRPSAPLAALSALAAVPAAAYAATMLAQAREAGPSCFLGGCAYGDRLAEMAALAIAIVLAGLLAAAKSDGWRLTAWCVAAAAMLVGAASVALPDATGSLGSPGGALAVGWGGLFALVGELQRRGERSSGRRDRSRSAPPRRG